MTKTKKALLIFFDKHSSFSNKKTVIKYYMTNKQKRKDPGVTY